ncbi:MAG: AMP-binding protein [Planctomycetes bacterium]|nr:AMP-binding protein [Planctomycetota bacterium]
MSELLEGPPPKTSLETRCERLEAGALATIVYTSGSTGLPKGVEITHAQMLHQVESSSSRFPLDADRDVALSCLPPAHIFERMTLYYYMSRSVSLHFSDDIRKTRQYLAELRPTVITLVPRVLEKVYLRMKSSLAAGSLPKRVLGRLALDHARRDEEHSALRSLWHGVLDRLVYGRLRGALGGRLRMVIIGGAALSKELNVFFLSVGIPVYQGYGMTECSPVIAANYPGCNRPGSVGKAFPGVSIRIGANLEVLVKGPGVMRGYHLDPEATAAAIDPEGWLHTGDMGWLSEEGFLTLSGRLKDLQKTANGKYVCPGFIEGKLRESPLILDALVLAENRRFVSCLLFADFEALPPLKERLNQGQTPDDDFLQSSALQGLIQEHIDRVNQKLNSWERIREFRLLPEVPSAATGELTPTMKLKRSVVVEKYRQVIDSIYQEEQTT